MQILLFILPLLAHMPKRTIKKKEAGNSQQLPAKSMKKKKVLFAITLCSVQVIIYPENVSNM